MACAAMLIKYKTTKKTNKIATGHKSFSMA